MKISACTIAAHNYLAQANILARSFLRHHRGSEFTILVVDQLGPVETRADGVKLLSLEDLDLDPGDSHRMPLIYDVTELSTAVKPWLLQRLSRSHKGPVIYFDPDIEIFAPLDDIGELAQEHSIVLTPHVTEPMPRDDRQLSESDILASGIYNLGFIAIGEGTDKFLRWWATRLRRESVIDPTRMRFTDQRWIDFVPGLFPHYILRDPSCNVAYWNLYSRSLVWCDDHYEVNGQPLRFFHYSGYNPNRPHILSKHQGNRPRTLLSEQPGVARICAEYREQLMAKGFEEKKRAGYGFDRLPGGLKVDQHVRRAYREALLDFEAGRGPEPPNPFMAQSDDSFIDWLSEPMNPGNPAAVTRYMLAVHSSRPDLQNDFPAPLAADAVAFRSWMMRSGRREGNIPKQLLARWSEPVTHGKTLAAPVESVTSNPSVTVAGYFRAELGVGEAARRLIAGLEAADIPYHTLLYNDTVSRQDHPFVASAKSGDESDIEILCINADQTPIFAQRRGGEMRRRRYTIGLWFWEVEEFPSFLHQAFNYVDEVWVASEFMEQTLRKVSPRPVFKFPLPVTAPEVDRSFSRSELGLPECFSFLFSFDFMSVFERKNPLDLIDAFVRAFPSEGEAALVIKAINGDKKISDLEKLRYAVAQYPQVALIEGYLPAQAKDTMMALCDCYVSLHRAEGYGLTIAEAMALGRPAIATAYSGNLDFMNAENSYLCPYRLISIGSGHEPYPAHARWAAPNVEEAANLMRQVYENPQEARTRGERAAREMQRDHSSAIAGAVVRERLEEIRRKRLGSSVEIAGVSRETEQSDFEGRQLRGAIDDLQEQVQQQIENGADGTVSGLVEIERKIGSVSEHLRQLELTIDNFRDRQETADRELWDLRTRRADATARANHRQAQLDALQRSPFWKLVKPLLKLRPRSPQAGSRAPSDLVFEVEKPEHWKSGEKNLAISGWCFSQSGRPLAGVRVRVDRKPRLARYGIKRADLARQYPQHSLAWESGFAVEVPVPAGAKIIRLEYVVQDGDWEQFFEHRLGG